MSTRHYCMPYIWQIPTETNIDWGPTFINRLSTGSYWAKNSGASLQEFALHPFSLTMLKLEGLSLGKLRPEHSCHQYGKASINVESGSGWKQLLAVSSKSELGSELYFQSEVLRVTTRPTTDLASTISLDPVKYCPVFPNRRHSMSKCQIVADNTTLTGKRNANLHKNHLGNRWHNCNPRLPNEAGTRKVFFLVAKAVKNKQLSTFYRHESTVY